MLATINLNSKFCSMTIKIKNVVAHNLLAIKTKRMISEKSKPKYPFLFSHIFTKLLSILE